MDAAFARKLEYCRDDLPPALTDSGFDLRPVGGIYYYQWTACLNVRRNTEAAG